MKNSQSGQMSRTLIILAAVILVMIVVIYGVMKVATDRKAKLAQEAGQTNDEPQKPVYETTIGDIRFLLDSSIDLGPMIKAETPFQQDLVTTEKFLYVTVRAQNKGKANTSQYAWGIGNIVDSEGRNFIEYNNGYQFLPRPDLCGAVLKPEFEPTPCVRIYEVSKVSTNLKLQVEALGPNSSKAQTALIDLNVK